MKQKPKKCPVCQSTRMNSYRGKTVCQRCGYTHIEEEEREIKDNAVTDK